ncbi:hypothetical protein NoPa_00010 [Pseudomonas phage vB_PpuM-NoPa]|uniref:Phage neck terminator protein gp12-like domain-containing protein n=3 Tax=Tartuvirus TaxID=3424912 RepID=A0AAX4MZ03_9CAUD
MNVYQNLEDSLYNVVEGLFPDWRTIFAFGNGPEPQTPYCVIDVKKINPIGREYQSSLAHVDVVTNAASTVTIQDNLTSIRFEVIGQYDQNTTTAEMINLLQLGFRTQKGYELLARNNLALHGSMTTRRIPLKRETQMYMVYQLDVTFAYSVVTSQDVDWIEVTSVQGKYYDAGREPDHIIIGEEISVKPPYE